MAVQEKVSIPKEEIASFCRQNRIKELALFGSVLRDGFRQDSDVDVLVDFELNAGHSLFDFIRMQEELSRLFGRKVDLVEKTGLHNPFRRYEILRTRQVIFAS
ncbi:MAG: nucleotidyltransferase family protein [Nitrospirae bacterium]|nr:nucleotidyltransferase family protein [Nitrospirota bacterium]